jgi:hypothetical protein
VGRLRWKHVAIQIYVDMKVACRLMVNPLNNALIYIMSVPSVRLFSMDVVSVSHEHVAVIVPENVMSPAGICCVVALVSRHCWEIHRKERSLALIIYPICEVCLTE